LIRWRLSEVLRTLLPGLLLACAASVRAAGPEVLSIPFEWLEIELQGQTLPRAAMLVPVDATLKNGPVLQFDTGAQ